MIEIKKGREPQKLITYRLEKFASYDGMKTDVKEAVLESLMDEQGHLCAYCMRRIPQKKKNPSVTIEHWAAQSENDALMGLNYRNMLAVCSGNRGCGTDKNLTCDARRGNQELTVNPLKPETLSEIEYHKNGVIFSKNAEIDKELNHILNLNCEAVSLPESRRKALQSMLAELKKRNPNGDIKLQCRRLLEKYQSQTTRKEPYVGILIWWLQHHT